jgi:carboxyl-terminal processing protease
VGAIPDSLIKEFKTKSGRSVYDGGGITPDVRVETKGLSRIAIELISRYLAWDFAVQYLHNHNEIATPELFSLTDEEYDGFITFMEKQEFDGRSATEIVFEQLLATAVREGYDSTMVKQLREVKATSDGNRAKDLLRHKEEIKNLLEDEICSMYYYQQGRIRSMLRSDEQLKRAKEILSDRLKYQQLLTPQHSPATVGWVYHSFEKPTLIEAQNQVKRVSVTPQERKFSIS